MLTRRAAEPEPPDLRIGTAATASPAGEAYSPGLLVARHTVTTSTAEFRFVLVAGERIGRRGLSEAIADAVAELRAVDVTYSPLRHNSLVSLLRRGEVAPQVYPPLADIVDRCLAMRVATEGWFDPWAVPGGFDPAGMIKGWAIERAASRLRAAGISDYAVVSGGDLTVRGHAPHGGPWRIALSSPAARGDAHRPPTAPDDPHRPPTAPDDPDRPPTIVTIPPTIVTMVDGAIGTCGLAARRSPVIDPHRGTVVRRESAAAVIGPDLAVADGYATALFAAGPAGRHWFPTVDGYQMLTGAPATARPAPVVSARDHGS